MRQNEMSVYEPQDDEDVNPVREMLRPVTFWDSPLGAFVTGFLGGAFCMWWVL